MLLGFITRSSPPCVSPVPTPGTSTSLSSGETEAAEGEETSAMEFLPKLKELEEGGDTHEPLSKRKDAGAPALQPKSSSEPPAEEVPLSNLARSSSRDGAQPDREEPRPRCPNPWEVPGSRLGTHLPRLYPGQR